MMHRRPKGLMAQLRSIWECLDELETNGGSGSPGPQGPKGDTGDTGPAGPQGETGAQGPAGATGSQGPAGATGSAGAAGPKGDTGDTGPPGAAGSQGPAGNDGAAGAQGPQGIQGEAGSDGWTYARLANDFTTSSATAVDVTGLAFTPAANQRYEFEGRFMLRTATTTVGARPGLAWPTGGADGVADVFVTSSATAEVAGRGNIAGSILAPVGGLPNTTASWPGRVGGIFIAGASPSGNVRVQLASETAATNVTMKAGSFLKYRLIP